LLNAENAEKSIDSNKFSALRTQRALL
jgi:hypothetical protein